MIKQISFFTNFLFIFLLLETSYLFWSGYRKYHSQSKYGEPLKLTGIQAFLLLLSPCLITMFSFSCLPLKFKLPPCKRCVSETRSPSNFGLQLARICSFLAAPSGNQMCRSAVLKCIKDSLSWAGDRKTGITPRLRRKYGSW